jgi:GT2 family glycosyltransferase
MNALDAVMAQHRPPDEIYVVDNDSEDGTADLLRGRSDLTYVRLDDNVGYAAGLAAGIDAAWSSDCDSFWLMDDDSSPHPDALSRLADVADQAVGAGIVGLRGGLLRGGMVRHLAGPQALSQLPSPLPGVREVGFVLVDGALLRRSAVAVAGAPRSDFFMMLEDVELSWRIGRAGLSVLVLESELIDRGHLGSTDTTSKKPQWRRYYQSRNHVRWAIESRSAILILGCVRRQLRFIAVCLLSPRARRRRLMAHVRGIWDGVRGRMGRTVEPGAM